MSEKTQNKKKLRQKRAFATFFIFMFSVLGYIGTGYIALNLFSGADIFGNANSLDDYILVQIIKPEAETSQPNTEQTEGPDLVFTNEDWDTFLPVEQTLNYVSTAPDARMLALPQNGKVSNDYFKNALFIGDSIAQGFDIYAPTGGGNSINAGFKSIGPREIISNISAQLQNKETVNTWDFISSQTPTSIYIALGTNALISLPDDEGFLKYYGDFLDAVKAQFPTIPIYLNSITPVTADEALRRPAMSNERITGLNNWLALMATEKGIYFLNVSEILTDDTGAMREELSVANDGFHMQPQAYAEWADYITSHTVVSPHNAPYLIVPYDSDIV